MSGSEQGGAGSAQPQEAGPARPGENDRRNARREQFRALLRALRELRAEVNDLARLVAQVKNGTTTVEANADYLSKTADDVAELIDEIGTLNERRRSDTIRHITNCWEQMRAILISWTAFTGAINAAASIYMIRKMHCWGSCIHWRNHWWRN